MAALLFASVDHGDDVRVLELRDRASLALEPLHEFVVGVVLLVEHLQGHVPLEQRVTRLVDARHAAVADELLQLVAVRNGLTDHGGKLPRTATGMPGN